jgi:hypothetical protein
MNVLQKSRPSFAFIQVLAFAVVLTGAASRAAGQAGTVQTVIQKATEQFENSPLKVTSLGHGLYMFSGDGGNVTAIVDDGSTLLIDSGLPSRITELSDAVFKTTMRPVTRLVNTHWHFDHTGGIHTSAPQALPSSPRNTLSSSSRPYKTSPSLACATVIIRRRRSQVSRTQAA